MLTKRGRTFLLFAFAALTLVSLAGLTRLDFQFNFEAFLPEDDPDILFYDEFKQEFQEGTNTVVVGIRSETGTFDPEFLDRVASFTRCSKRLPLVEDAFSLPTIHDYIYDPFIPLRVPVLEYGPGDDLTADSLAIMADPRWPGNMISYDGKLMIVHMSTPVGRSQYEEDWFNTTLWDLLDEYGWKDSSHAIGYPIFHQTMVKSQTSEFGLYTVLAAIVMLICMVLLFRRFWGALIAFVSVILGLIFFFGLLGWVGQPIDLMATLFPVLIVIVGTSDVIHIMTKYVDELHRGSSTREALKITLREIGIATFLTSLTTAIGFLSLLASNMPPIRTFGLFAAIGVFMAFGTVILLNTALVSWFPAKALMRPRTRKPFTGILARTEAFTRRRPRAIAWGTLVFSLLAIWAATGTSLNLTNQRDFPIRSRILHDFVALDEALHGVNSLDIAIRVADGRSLYELPVQRELARLEAYFSGSEYGSVVSPLTMFRLANLAWNGPGNFKLAEDQGTFDRQLKVIDKFAKDALRMLLSEDGQAAWLYVKAPDIGSVELMKVKDEMDEWVKNEMQEGMFTFTHTGARHIFDKHQGLLVFSMLKSIALAFLTVSLFMGLVFKNIRVVIISLIPNVVPLLATAAFIGLLGLQLDPKIAIVFTIAFGIAVDDSIHFLSRFKLERDRGLDNRAAIQATFQESGRAIILTTLILFFGFSVLLASSFPPTLTIGGLLALTLLVALVADFLLIPILINWLLPEKKSAPVMVEADENSLGN